MPTDHTIAAKPVIPAQAGIQTRCRREWIITVGVRDFRPPVIATPAPQTGAWGGSTFRYQA
jgi:hypothetical protein